MPGVEVISSIWTSSREGHLDGTEVTGNDSGVSRPPTWSGNGEMPWAKAAASKAKSSHMAQVELLDGYPADSSHLSWPVHAQYSNNPYISARLDPRVDSMPRPENAMNGELSLQRGNSVPDHHVFKPHKHLPRRRHLTDNAVNLRSQFNTAESDPSIPSHAETGSNPSPGVTSSTHSLPPTPPTLQHEVSEYDFENSSNAETATTAILRSRIVTPTPQHSPPTPDNTPPRLDNAHSKRPFLGTQPSLASTRAESFQTAREEVWSEDEEEATPLPKMGYVPQWLHAVSSTIKAPFQVQPSPLAQEAGELDSADRSRDDLQDETTGSQTKEIHERVNAQVSDVRTASIADEGGNRTPIKPHVETVEALDPHSASADDPDNSPRPNGPSRTALLTPPRSPDQQTAQQIQEDLVEKVETVEGEPALPTSDLSFAEAATEVELPRRGQSLRERLEESRRIEERPSVEQFGDEIGWSGPARSSGLKSRVDSWRHSGVSTASTVEAIVVEREPKRQQTLRHRGRNVSLRSASSPIPASNRHSLLSNPDSPHRLQHKKARLSNQNRWSFGSEVSRSLSISSTTAPQPKLEIIRVAVIPERTTSLRSSANSSNRNSASLSGTSGGRRSIRTDDREEMSDVIRHRRGVSESFPSSVGFSNRGRDKRFPPPVPARSSSLSAPTSRSNSRANSITSEHLRLRTVAAEEDVRNTLARMESERVIPTAQIFMHPTDLVEATPVEPDAEHWANLRPPSTQRTPFSQQSVHSASPVVEMGEAKAVNFFPHNNHSLQIIESNPLPESRAVQELYTSGRNLQIATDEPTTPVAPLLPILSVESPLRNPRDPPKPPHFKVIPPTPASLTPTDEVGRQLSTKGPGRKGSGRRFGSLRRPLLADRRRSDSFVKSFGRSLSLNAKNRKADQNLDSTLHPFWRPRGFWDEFSESDNDEGNGLNDRDKGLVVNNSLGMPQQRTIIDGPLSLVRKISDGSRRQRQNRGVAKRSSYGSLSRFRLGRKVYKVPGLSLRFQVIGFHDLQQRMLSVKHRKEDERRDRRREELRRSIGPNVISQGDSRYISPSRMTEPPGSGLTPDVD